MLCALTAVAESKGMIYGIYKAGDQTWFIDEGAAAEAAAKGAGYDFTYVDAKMSPEEYLRAIDNAIANNAAGVVTCIPDQTMSQAAVDKLAEAGIPVVGAGSVEVLLQIIDGQEVTMETAVDAVVVTPETYVEVMSKDAE